MWSDGDDPLSGLHRITIHCEIDSGHRVVGHEGKCARLHGHRWQVDISLAASSLTPQGFVMDFGEVKQVVNEWDHRLLLWDEDPLIVLNGADTVTRDFRAAEAEYGVIRVPVNPTSENLGRLLHERLHVAAPDGVEAIHVQIRETPGTSSTWGSRP